MVQTLENGPREVKLRLSADRLRQLKARALHYLGRDAEIDLSEFTSTNRVIRANRASILARSGKCQEALQIRATFGDVGRADDESGIHVLVDLFEAGLYCRDKATAAALYERLLPLANRINGLNFVSIGRLLAEAAVMLDQTDESMPLFEEALALCQKIRFRPELVLIQLDIGELLLTGDASQRLRGIDQINTAIEQARAMKMQPSVERGLSLLKQKNASNHVVNAGGLTPREIEVASLLASGQTNKEIAKALVISESTAEVHVKRILSKLGFRSRSHVAAWAAERHWSARRTPDQ
jgi:DNA-binding CsgD family transcriptional regulator